MATDVSNDRYLAARSFFSYLTAASVEEDYYFHLWRLDIKTTFWHKPQHIDLAAQKVIASTGDIYIGVGLSDRMFGKTERLKEQTATGRFAFVADLDCKPGGFASKEHALDFVEILLIQPQIIVDSGGGIQCWWVFERPWIFQDEEDKQRCQRYAQGWHEFLARKAGRLGLKLDSVFDLARVMRVPGGFNRKQSEPRLVETLRYRVDRVHHEVFADFEANPQLTAFTGLPSPSNVAKLATVNEFDDIDQYIAGHGRATKWIDELTFQEWELFKTACPKWEGTYKMTRRDPRMRDKSKSEFAYSLAGQAAWVNAFPYSLILKAVVNFYRANGGIGDKENRLDWFVQTVRKAASTNPAGPGGGEAGLLATANEALVEEQIAPLAEENTENVDAAEITRPPDKTASIARLLGVPVTAFIKWGVDPVVFGVQIRQRKIEIGDQANVLSQRHWKAVLYGAGFAMKSIPPPMWEKILVELQKCWVNQPMGAVADKVLNLKHMIADLVINQGTPCHTRADILHACKRGMPYIDRRQGKTVWWIPTRVVRRLVEERDGQRPTNTQLNRDMAKIGYGYERKNSAAPGSSIDGLVKIGYYFGAPLPNPEFDPRTSATLYRGEDDDEDE